MSYWEFLPWMKFGSLSGPRKASCNRVVLPNPNQLKCMLGSFRVSIIPPNSDMDYRICNVRTVIILISALGVDTANQHNIFDSEKLSQMFFVLLMQAGSNRRPCHKAVCNTPCQTAACNTPRQTAVRIPFCSSL